MKSFQQILSISTTSDSIRSEAVGWSCDDSALVVAGKPIGFTPGPEFRHTYDCVLRAMADGWQVLGQPEKFEAGETEGEPDPIDGTPLPGKKIYEWYWMLSRVVETP